MQKGFTLLEIIISLLLLSIGLLGALHLDKESASWLNQTYRVQEKSFAFNQAAEIVASTESALKNSSCPACDIMNHPLWNSWKASLPNGLESEISMPTQNSLQIELCEDSQCTDAIFQV